MAGVAQKRRESPGAEFAAGDRAAKLALLGQS